VSFLARLALDAAGEIMRLLFAAAFLLLSFVYNPAAHAQSPAPPWEILTQSALKSIDDTEAAIPGWQHAADVYWRVSVGVMLLGLLSSGLAALSALRAQHGPTQASINQALTMWAVAAIAIGLATTGSTWWLQNGFASDRKGYLRAIETAKVDIKKLRDQIELYRAGYRSSQFPDFNAAAKYIKDNVDPLSAQVDTLRTNLIAELGPSSGLEATAYAEVPSPRSISVTSVGDCNVLTQSNQASRVAAIEKAMLALNVDIASASQRDALRSYVRTYVTLTPEIAGTKVRTTATLSPTFTNSSVIAAALQSGRKTFDVEADIEALSTGSVTPHDSAVILDGGKANMSFTFTFDVTAERDGLTRLRVRTVLVSGVSSPGTAGWKFQMLAGGFPVLELPLASWDPSGRPTSCNFEADAQWSKPVKASSAVPVPLTIVALRSTGNPRTSGKFIDAFREGVKQTDLGQWVRAAGSMREAISEQPVPTSAIEPLRINSTRYEPYGPYSYLALSLLQSIPADCAGARQALDYSQLERRSKLMDANLKKAQKACGL
jgi:hypothetical protein